MGDTGDRTGLQGGYDTAGEVTDSVARRAPSSRAEERRAALTRYLAAEQYHEVRAAPASASETREQES